MVLVLVKKINLFNGGTNILIIKTLEIGKIV
jgi:hypothetical protein